VFADQKESADRITMAEEAASPSLATSTHAPDFKTAATSFTLFPKLSAELRL